MPSPASSRIRVANAPVSFGVDESASGDGWMPEAPQVLAWMAELGYEGTEMGPPGFLGPARQVRAALTEHGLDLVGAFLPLHMSRADRFEDDLVWLDEQLSVLLASAPATSRPLAVLCEAIDEPERLAFTGRMKRDDASARSSQAKTQLVRMPSNPTAASDSKMASKSTSP